jgi:oxidoreductase
MLTLGSRSKGLTEQGLAHLGYKDTIILRPAFLAQAERPEKRILETVLGYIQAPKYLYDPLLTHFLPDTSLVPLQ